MNESFERAWVAFLNSDRFRRFAKQGVGSSLFRSTAYQQLNTIRRYLTTWYISHHNPSCFHNIKTYCMFIGHNKSGTSMIGSLLDAHPNIIIADEADALQYVPAGFSRNQIFHILLKGSRREAMKGRVTARRLSPYAFAVPAQWQGCYSDLRVIGDGTVGTSTRRLAGDPDLLRQLQTVMSGIDVKFIQLIRNPYDPISIIMVRGKRTFANAIEHYFANCEAIAAIRKRLDSSSLFAVKYEDFIRHPETNLFEIGRFLGIEAGEDYLQACTRILHKSPDHDRHLVAWDAKWIGVVKNNIERFDFLHGYAFEH